MKKILITGANSYIGTSFENYIKKNYPEDFTVDTVDMRDGSWKEKSFSDYDAIFHVAGIAHIKETKDNAEAYYKINRDLVIDVAAKAKADGVKQFVFLSSMSVYGLTKGTITKDTVPAPKSNYGKSKLQAEQELLKMEDKIFKICVLRPPMVYGNGCKGNYQTLRKLALKLPFFPYVKNERSMIYIDNLSEFVRLMIVNEESGVFFPQNEEYTNTSEMVKLIAEANGKKIHFVKGFTWALKILSLFTGLVNKAFGSLTYDKVMSEYKNNYCVLEYKRDIKYTEGKRNE
jgi:UDP-glucose 4-epimerase